MKYSSLIILSLSMAPSLSAQVSVTFQPDALQGEDAKIWVLDSKCIPSDVTQTPEYVNYGNEPDLAISDWTWNAVGCSHGTVRSMIRFTGLSTLPATANILSAELVLHTPPSGPYWGNSYPDLPNTNEGWVQRIKPGSALPDNWDEQTVTWDTQPSVVANIYRTNGGKFLLLRPSGGPRPVST